MNHSYLLFIKFHISVSRKERYWPEAQQGTQDGTDWVGAGLLGLCQAAPCFLWPLKFKEQIDFNIKPRDRHITFYSDVT